MTFDKYSTKPTEIFNVSGKHPDDIVYGTEDQSIFSMIPHFFFEFNADPTVSVIYAGPTGGRNGTSVAMMPTPALKHYLLKTVKPETKFCFDNLFEGNFTPIIDRIYKAIAGTHINPAQCNYFSCALDSNDLHNIYCEKNNIIDRINIYTCNTWEYSLIKNSTAYSPPYVPKERKKTFLCFNRIVRPHRFGLVALCNEANLLDSAYYSYFGDARYGDDEIDIGWMRHILREASSPELYNRIIKSYHDISSRFPLKLNINWQENINFVMESDADLFDESYLSVVTETFFYPYHYLNNIKDGEAIFFTEKIFKPIYMRHPFVIASRPHSLAYLRKIGFKTFSPLIDESYDEIENDSERLEAVVKELSRLNAFTSDQWMEWQKQIKSVVDHNYRVMATRPKHQYVLTRPDHENQY